MARFAVLKYKTTLFEAATGEKAGGLLVRIEANRRYGEVFPVRV